ncbi:MAG TPA: protein-L-isoaspartate(D-aspartate) O-methyltransferase [Desulfonatronum sp.]|nr:protein-L-isoaspartate(D-aspartate) O-methyltransferase [Desulfonatronum sp.]
MVLTQLGLIASSALAEDTEQMRQARERMVREQLIERYGFRDNAVLKAMRAVPRHLFIPERERHAAYADRPVPIGYGQTISQPFIVAYMTAIAKVDQDSRVLEIGAGSGYQAAVLAELTEHVYTIEIVSELAKWAEERLLRAGYDTVRVKQGDGYYGWEEFAPFDAIVVTAAAPHIPPSLVQQLKEGGRIVIPVGSPFRTQQLVLVERKGDEVRTRNLMPVRFVPFTREF